MRSKKIFVPSNIILFIILAIVLVVAVFTMISLRVDELQKKLSEKNAVAFIFNVSDNENVLFSEIVIYHPEKHTLAIADFPVNYGSVIKSLSRIDRIDAIYKKGKPDQYIRKIEGECSMEIPYYFDIGLDNLCRCIDVMGGLDVVVGTPVDIYDTTEGAFLLPSGRHHFDGEKVVQCIRSFDQTLAESELISNRQRLILQIIRTMGKNSEYLNNDDVFAIFYKLLGTSLSKDGLKTFIATMDKADTEHVLFQRVLGDRKVVDDKVLLFPYYDGNMLRENVRQTIESLESGDIMDMASSEISIEILNGTDVSGLANRTSIEYKNYGYNIKSIGNAEDNAVKQTVVIGHISNAHEIEKVANIIRCKNISSEGETVECITIILGKDFDGRYCK